MSKNQRVRLALVAVAVLIVAGLLGASHLHVGKSGLFGAIDVYGGGGSGGTAKITSITFAQSGSTGTIQVLSASVTSTATISVPVSDPNYSLLWNDWKATQAGDTSLSVKTMYLHFRYSDGTTSQDTLETAYVSSLTSGALTASGTATSTVVIHAASITLG